MVAADTLPAEAESADAVLVTRARTGDAAAFEMLVQKYFGMICAVAYARLLDREASEELAQEVFLRLHLRLADLTHPQHVAAWLTRVTRNLGEDWARKQQRCSRLVTMVPLSDLKKELPQLPNIDTRSGTENSRAVHALNAALLSLPAADRELVLLHHVDEVTKAELARRRGEHQSTVGRRLDRCLRILRESLTPADTAAAVQAITKPRTNAVRQTLAVTASAAVMSAASRTALAAAETASFPAKAICAVTTYNSGSPVSTLLVTGVKVMTSGKKASLMIAASAALIGGGVHVYQAKATGSGWLSSVFPSKTPARITEVILPPADAAQASECQMNLLKIVGAKQQYAIEFKSPAGTEVTMADLVNPPGTTSPGQGFFKSEKKCPAGGTYSLGAFGAGPTCSHGAAKGHALDVRIVQKY